MVAKAEYYEDHESREELENIAQEPDANNERPVICTACGGRCCKRSPGMYLPEDFGPASIMKEKIKACVRGGMVQFDYWEGDFEGHDSPKYPRASLREAVGKIVHASWGGECANLQSDGCMLEFEDRPAECRDLVPAEAPGECHMDRLNKRAILLEWVPYQGMIAEIISELVREGNYK